VLHAITFGVAYIAMLLGECRRWRLAEECTAC
jgi:hypothetical protein